MAWPQGRTGWNVCMQRVINVCIQAFRRTMITRLAAARCNIFVHTLDQPLPAHRMPPAWADHQHAIELHLAAAARRSPWRTYNRSEADLVVALANYSLFCIAGKTFGRRTQWYNMQSERALWPKGAAQASWQDGGVLVVLQAIMCGLPWADVRGAFKPANTLILAEALRNRDRPSSVMVSPFVVASPAWLVGEDGAASGSLVHGDAERRPLAVPWATRKLLFFSGHVPKLFQNSLRYLLWKQTRRDLRVSASSWTIICTVGAYRTCLESNEELRRRGRELERTVGAEKNAEGKLVSGLVTLLATHCHQLGCANTSSCDASRARTTSDDKALRSFRQRCAPYLKLVNFSTELDDMQTDHMASRSFAIANRGYASLSPLAASGRQDKSFLRKAMAHRFCLVAPGDTASTKKISETVALGGAGGCIPVLVVPKPAKLRAEGMRQGQDESKGLGPRLARFLPCGNSQLEPTSDGTRPHPRPPLKPNVDAWTTRATPHRPCARV